MISWDMEIILVGNFPTRSCNYPSSLRSAYQFLNDKENTLTNIHITYSMRSMYGQYAKCQSSVLPSNLHSSSKRDDIIIPNQRRSNWHAKELLVGLGVTSAPQFPGLRTFLCTNHLQQCQWICEQHYRETQQGWSISAWAREGLVMQAWGPEFYPQHLQKSGMAVLLCLRTGNAETGRAHKPRSQW